MEQQKANVKTVIEALIAAGTSFDIDQLEQIYHDDLQVLMIDEAGTVSNADKGAFKALFQTKLEAGDPPLNTAANFDHIEAAEGAAHVLVRRTVKLMEEEQNLILSIDLVHEDDRWQVMREVIFARSPN